jgi:hypothetical protein
MTQYNPYLENYYEKYTTSARPPLARRITAIPGWQRMGIILLAIAVIVPLLLMVKPAPAIGEQITAPAGAAEPLTEGDAAGVPGAVDLATEKATGRISPVFAEPVQHWAPQIVAWADVYGLDPNIAATIMQIESCGDPQAISSAGAQGLFQVMPFHFAAGEDALDPDTNARRGLNYYVERLQQTNGDVGKAFAGYNGGHRAAGSSWDAWPHETQRYYVWSTGIYGDIQQGLSESPTLQEWLQAGGASLCNQAAQRLGLS